MTLKPVPICKPLDFSKEKREEMHAKRMLYLAREGLLSREMREEVMNRYKERWG